MGIARFRLLVVAAVAVVAVLAALRGAGQLGGAAEAEISPAQTAALAAQVGPGDVVVYTTEDCLYCKLAREWLEQHSVAYTECDINASAACAKAYRAYGARGTPFLVVRGQQMREGFQPDVFLNILRQRRT